MCYASAWLRILRPIRGGNKAFIRQCKKLSMDVRKRFRDIRDIFILSEKPGKKEFTFSLRLSLIGLFLVGSIAFVIDILMTAVFHP